jgi:hypothetical protein
VGQKIGEETFVARSVGAVSLASKPGAPSSSRSLVDDPDDTVVIEPDHCHRCDTSLSSCAEVSARPLHRNPSPCCTSAATGADDIDARGVLPLLTGVPVRDGYNHLIDTAHA